MAGGRTIGMMALVASVAGLSCQSGSFTCISNESCAGLEGGACESNGLCSVPNPECVSGREYAELSGGASGECVPAMSETSSTGSQPSTGDPDGSSEVGPMLTTSADSGSSSSSSSSSSGAGLDETGSTTAGETSGTTAMPPCGAATPAYHHDFADGMFAPRDWTVNSFGQVDASFDDGTLSVSTEADGMGSDVWWMVSTFSAPTVGSVAMELVESPPPDSTGSFWVELSSPRIGLSFSVRDAQLRTTIRTADGPYIEQALGQYDPVDDLWLRMQYDPATVTVLAQTSPDGLTWSTFHDFDTSGFGFGNFDIDIGGGTFSGSTHTGVVASVAEIAVCED